VIAIDQDALGRQGHRVKKDGDIEMWARPLSAGAHAVGLFNRGETSANVTVSCEELQLCGGYTIRDVWAGADAGKFVTTYSTSIPRHGVVLLRVAPSRAAGGNM
jgi:alpha-galactosidase